MESSQKMWNQGKKMWNQGKKCGMKAKNVESRQKLWNVGKKCGIRAKKCGVTETLHYFRIEKKFRYTEVYLSTR